MIIVLGAVAAWCVLSALLFLWKPFEDFSIIKGRRNWSDACEGAAFFGWMGIFYAAFSNLLSFMPDSWGSEDEDGEWRPMSGTISGMLAFPIAIAVMSRVDSFHRITKQLQFMSEMKQRNQ